MGSTTEKALAAADKIQKAVEANLRERIEITACLARIGIGRSSLIYRGLMMEDLAGLLSDFRGMLESPDTPDRTEGAGGVHPVAAAASPTVEIPVSSRLGHAAPHASHAIPTQSTTTSGVRASVPAFGAAGAGPGAGAVVEVPASGPLASHVAGLATVALGCPAYPLVEFALDGAGGLHLLALADSHEGSWKTAGSLLAAGQWAKAHAALIALAAQATGQKVDAASTPVLHLFTPVAKGAGTFADAGVRPHLLVQVKVEGRAGWYSTELA